MNIDSSLDQIRQAPTIGSLEKLRVTARGVLSGISILHLTEQQVFYNEIRTDLPACMVFISTEATRLNTQIKTAKKSHSQIDQATWDEVARLRQIAKTVASGRYTLEVHDFLRQQTNQLASNVQGELTNQAQGCSDPQSSAAITLLQEEMDQAILNQNSAREHNRSRGATYVAPQNTEESSAMAFTRNSAFLCRQALGELTGNRNNYLYEVVKRSETRNRQRQNMVKRSLFSPARQFSQTLEAQILSAKDWLELPDFNRQRQTKWITKITSRRVAADVMDDKVVDIAGVTAHPTFTISLENARKLQHALQNGCDEKTAKEIVGYCVGNNRASEEFGFSLSKHLNRMRLVQEREQEIINARKFIAARKK